MEGKIFSEMKKDTHRRPAARAVPKNSEPLARMEICQKTPFFKGFQRQKFT
jgi:hypothetical protein